MITVLFPAGCYGNFFASVLYEGTSLSINDTVLSKVDPTGSLHDFRNNIHAKSKIQWGHLNVSKFRHTVDPSQSVVILPCRENRLDYIDNQLTKQTNSDVFAHIRGMYESASLQQSIKQFQNVDNLSDMDPWVLREFVSFWILDMLDSAFIADAYVEFNATVYITTNDIFLNFESSLDRVTETLELDPHRRVYIFRKFNEFKETQKFHGMQQRCDEWIEHVLSNRVEPCPCITVFDEAYVQAKLRTLGFEIRCYQLNEFPKESLKLADLLYPTN